MMRLVWALLVALVAIFGSLFGLRRCDEQASTPPGSSTSSPAGATDPHAPAK